MQPLIVKALKTTNKVIFGPFIGDLYSEIIFSRFLKWYKINSPEQTITVSTRNRNIRLYDNYIENIHLFDLPIDKANGFTYPLNKNEYLKIIENIKENYSYHFIYTTAFLNKGSITKKFVCDEIKTSFSEKNMIEQICKHYRDKIPIIIDFNKEPRNIKTYSRDKLKTIAKFLSQSNYLILIPPDTSKQSDHKWISHFPIIDLNHYVDYTRNISPVGLTIEAIRQSEMIFGQLTSTTLLSKLENKPTLIYGTSNDKSEYNIFGFFNNFIEDDALNFSEADLMKTIKEFYKTIHIK